MAKAATRKRHKKARGPGKASARRSTAARASARKKTSAGGRRWSGRVTRESDALTLEPAVFTRKDPKDIARSLKRSADSSRRRKSSSFRSAMSMLTFYINRAGNKLPAARRKKLDEAKEALRTLYGRA